MQLGGALRSYKNILYTFRIGSLNGVFITTYILSSLVPYIYLIFYTPPVYAVPTATQNDGRNLFFVFTIVTVTGEWVVVGSLKSVFSAFGCTTPPLPIHTECILYRIQRKCAQCRLNNGIIYSGDGYGPRIVKPSTSRQTRRCFI